MTTTFSVFVYDEVSVTDSSSDGLFVGLVILYPATWNKIGDDVSLTEQEIIGFRCLYMDHFGIALTEEQAVNKGLRLTRILETTLKATAQKSRMTSEV